MLLSQPAARPALGATPRRRAPAAATSRVAARGLKENVAALAPITDVARVRIPALGWEVPNAEGKRASVAIYAHLAASYGGRLTVAACEEGLRLYAEVTEDAVARPGSHPNIDLLLRVAAAGAEAEAPEVVVDRV